VRFHVLTAISMKMAVFLDVAQCRIIEVYRRFRGTFCLYFHPDNVGSKNRQ
jgi:hypothetical protein